MVNTIIIALNSEETETKRQSNCPNLYNQSVERQDFYTFSWILKLNLFTSVFSQHLITQFNSEFLAYILCFYFQRLSMQSVIYLSSSALSFISHANFISWSRACDIWESSSRWFPAVQVVPMPGKIAKFTPSSLYLDNPLHLILRQKTGVVRVLVRS